ncbi:MAG: flavodoxin, partial [Muribaculaceae bacterium]|nr:flavodoxin [Muribaculaceae bacterium]
DSTAVADTADSKVLVAYYSATGTTAKAAERVAEATGGTLYEIVPETVYTDEDLDYENDNSRSAVENKNPDMRPAIKTGLDITPYDTVYVGFPVWWDKAPLVVYTFLDSYDFTGKKIIVFATAHSSGLTPSFEALKATYPKYNLTEGVILNKTSEKAFDEWVSSISK